MIKNFSINLVKLNTSWSRFCQGLTGIIIEARKCSVGVTQKGCIWEGSVQYSASAHKNRRGRLFTVNWKVTKSKCDQTITSKTCNYRKLLLLRNRLVFPFWKDRGILLRVVGFQEGIKREGEGRLHKAFTVAFYQLALPERSHYTNCLFYLLIMRFISHFFIGCGKWLTTTSPEITV